MYPNAKQEKNKTEEVADSEDSQGQLDEVSGPKGDHVMWRAVRGAMKGGTLLELRNSKPEGTTQTTRITTHEREKSKSSAKGMQGKGRVSQKRTDAQVSGDTKEGGHEDEDEDSDGGFFE